MKTSGLRDLTPQVWHGPTATRLAVGGNHAAIFILGSSPALAAKRTPPLGRFHRRRRSPASDHLAQIPGVVDLSTWSRGRDTLRTEVSDAYGTR